MILVGNQRGGAKNLAQHLLKEENEHVEVHEIRGFASESLKGALHEAYAISKGTKCRQYLFSLSLNPPQNENVSIDVFENAIDRVENRLGLSGQPRAIVFHEKEGRRHCHTVWSRIDRQEMKAIPLPYTKRKLQEIARELYLEHGWTMPRGFAKSQERDPHNFTLAEWQQAKRIGKDPRAIKAAFQDAWAISDSKTAFIHALEDRGFKIARGDRRSFVALDSRGEVYAIAKWAGVKTKQVRDRLGDDETLHSVEEVKQQIAKDMLLKMEQFGKTLADQAKERQTQFEMRRQELIERQRAERRALNEKISRRQEEERKERQKRFNTGLKGLWDWVSGKRGQIKVQNEREAYESTLRDRKEKEELIFRHLEQRRRLNALRTQERNEYQEQTQELRQDVQTYKGLLREQREERLKEKFNGAQDIYSEEIDGVRKRPPRRSLDR